MEGVGEPPVTRLQSSHAAPPELDSAERPLRYKDVAPAGAWTDPSEDSCTEQSKLRALQTLARHYKRLALLVAPKVELASKNL